MAQQQENKIDRQKISQFFRRIGEANMSEERQNLCCTNVRSVLTDVLYRNNR